MSVGGNVGSWDFWWEGMGRGVVLRGTQMIGDNVRSQGFDEGVMGRGVELQGTLMILDIGCCSSRRREMRRCGSAPQVMEYSH
jgi:hypothetical protein